MKESINQKSRNYGKRNNRTARQRKSRKRLGESVIRSHPEDPHVGLLPRREAPQEVIVRAKRRRKGDSRAPTSLRSPTSKPNKLPLAPCSKKKKSDLLA
jgi:hypothetical protein